MQFPKLSSKADQTAVQDVVSLTKDGYAIWDKDDRLVESNDCFADLFCEKGQALTPGDHYADILSNAANASLFEVGDSPEAWIEQRLDQHKSGVSQVELSTWNGRRYSWLESATDNECTISLLRDVTDRAEIDRQLLHLENKHRRAAAALATVRQELEEKSQSLSGLSKTLNAARSEAEKTDLALSTFMRSMSNELRTPLHSIIGFAEVMHDQLYGPLGDDRYKDYVTFIRDSGHTLLSLVAQILELSRIQTGRYDLNLSHEQIDPILECCTAAISSSASQRGINIEMRVAPNLPKIWIDSLATQNIVDELLKNALAFTPDGGSVTISVNYVQSDLVIEVSDTGVGIAETDLDRVLFPFEKANNSISKERRSYGLGLSLAIALVNLQGGELNLISSAGEGTTATITLPSKTLQVTRPL